MRTPLDLPADVERVLERWAPGSVARLSTASGAAVSLVVAPGMTDTEVRDALTREGLTVAESDTVAAIVLVDPYLPATRSVLTAVRALPTHVPRVVVVPDVTAEVANDVLSRVAAPTLAGASVVTSAADAARAVAESCRGVDDHRAFRSALDSAVAAARDALTAAAREDTASAELSTLRERRRAVGTTRGDSASRRLSDRRRLAQRRLDVGHRIGVHRRDTAARVSDAVASARGRDVSGLPGAVVGEIDAATARLAGEVADALADLDLPASDLRFGRSVTHQPPPARDRRSGEDVLAVVVGASAGAGVGRALTWATSIGGVAALIVAVVGAAAMGFAVMRTRAVSSRRARVRRWAVDVVADAAAAWERDAASALLTADGVLSAREASRADEEATRIDRVRADIDAEIREVTSRAAARAAAYQRDLDVLERPLHPGDRGTASDPRASKHVSGGRGTTEISGGRETTEPVGGRETAGEGDGDGRVVRDVRRPCSG